MQEKRYWLRAFGVGLSTFLTGLLMYPTPPEASAYWQPAIQGILAALTSLGLNIVTASKPPVDRDEGHLL